MYKVVQIWPGLICVYTSRTAQQMCDLERVKPQPPPSLLLVLEPIQPCLGVARAMSEQKVPRSVEQRIVIKFLVGENVPSAEIHHRLHQVQVRVWQLWFLKKISVPVIFEPPCIQGVSVNRAILQHCFFLVRQQWDGCLYCHFAANFKAF